jgi:hypothetical protein
MKKEEGWCTETVITGKGRYKNGDMPPKVRQLI